MHSGLGGGRGTPSGCHEHIAQGGRGTIGTTSLDWHFVHQFAIALMPRGAQYTLVMSIVM
jgi:hypothetical protein